ncbi:hypothetical protein ACSPX5_07910 [Pseudomonas sp. HLG18]|uniref:hypothetical protein n=1 Tax=Pseudomonas sp. HLG18 TaxID=3449277 RepID=UPI003F74508D
MRLDHFICCEHHFLASVNAKIKRSERQIYKIAEDLNLASDAIDIKVESEVKENGLGYRLIVKDLQGFSLEDISMQIGECVHNLRSSLDNLAYALARLTLDPPAEIKNIAFPVCIDKKSYGKNWKERVEKMFHPDVVAVIESVQPYTRTGEYGTPEGDPLYLLNGLNNSDKHRVPNLVVLAQEKIVFNGSIKYYRMEDAYADGAPDLKVSIDPIVSGMTLLDATTKYPVDKVEGHFNIHGRVMLEVNGEYYDSVEYLKMTRAYLMAVYDLFAGFFADDNK